MTHHNDGYELEESLIINALRNLATQRTRPLEPVDKFIVSLRVARMMGEKVSLPGQMRYEILGAIDNIITALSEVEL